jgi:hypothetical protein
MPDLAADLDRIRAHVGCLVLAAADPDARPAVRAAVNDELAAWRLAADLAGHDRTASERPGPTRNATEQLGTEAGRDA